MGNASKDESQNEKLIRLLEDQLAHSNQQNKDLSKQIEALTDQVRHLTKLLYGSKTKNRNITHQTGKVHYLMMTRLLGT
uniref:hypothetical protein n=1 Tax=Heyndrickxia sporothermodurans TaxID=46224 RepID=UPI0036D21E32